MLIAGVFLFWGVVFTNNSAEDLFAPASVIVALVISVWILYASHYRQLYLLKLHRIREIEAKLGMEANRRFMSRDQEAPVYRVAGLRGHNLDLLLYVLIAISGAILAAFRQGLEWWQLLPLIIAALVSGVVLRQERSSIAEVKKLEAA